MRLKIILVLFIISFVFGCRKDSNENVALGTWYKCNNDGSYGEYEITDNHMLILSTHFDEVVIFKNKIVDNKLMLSKFKNGHGFLGNNDTFITLNQSRNKIILKSKYSGNRLELNRTEIDFKPVDSNNLKNWQNYTLTEFKKRAELTKCPDLRTDEEKYVPTIIVDDELPDDELIIRSIDNEN